MSELNIKRIGTLTSDPVLLARLLQPGFRLGDFTNTASTPEALRTLLAAHGYDIAESDENQAMLFANTSGVPLHTDDQLSALWVLVEPDIGDYPTQLIVDGEDINLNRNDVLIFDATKSHGVIASTSGLWAVYSTYVTRRS